MPKQKDWQPRVAEVPEAPPGVPSLIWQTLYGRGYQSLEAVRDFMRPSLRALRSPLLLDGMQAAVERLLLAREKKEAICIYADFDLDGTSGLALLQTGLSELGFENLKGFQPRRLGAGYGVHVEAIEELFASGVTLLVTVDVGTTAFEALARAKELGMDVIVTDHHLPKETLPTVLALINPNKGTCSSELGHLSGAGVAYYLYLAVRKALREQNLVADSSDPKELLDFFVIGTLTDMVPLVAENRSLVKHGLWQLMNTRRPGLRALIEQLGLGDRELSSQDVAIRFAPKLNALSRLESGIRPIDVFLASDTKLAAELVGRVLEQNQERVRLQKEGEDAARQVLSERTPDGCVVVWSPGFHRGVVGLIATRLAQEWGVPAFVGAVDSMGRVVGSGRAPNGTRADVLKALEHASSHLVRFGGHAQAAGFELEEPQAFAFREKLEEFFSQTARDRAPTPTWFDALGTLDEVQPDFMKWHESLGPFGTQFELPVYQLRGMRLLAIKDLRGGHVRLELESLKTQKKQSAIWFSPGDKLNRDWQGGALRVLAQPEWNHYLGRRTLQLQLTDAQAD